MTLEALEACEHIGIKPESLQMRNIESFKPKDSEPAELADVRYNHYMAKRKCKRLCFILFDRKHFKSVQSSVTLNKHTHSATWKINKLIAAQYEFTKY